MPDIVDLYSGVGWAEGLRMLGLSEVGIEWNAAACATRAALGLATIRADLTDYPPFPCKTLIGSPPCQTFSSAGSGEGRQWIARLADQARRGDWSTDGLDDRTLHVLTPGRWIDAGCDTVLLEQVPSVLPIWKGYARMLAGRGWSTWAGVLCAADYGVPQTRERAFLIASRLCEIGPPPPTHRKGGATSLFGELAPWVSMADALGWLGEDMPARTVCGDRGPRWMYPDPDGTHGRMVNLTERQPHGASRSIDEPAMTIPASADNGNFRWVLDCRNQAGGVPVRMVPDDEPSPTVTQVSGGKSQWVWRRPATTIQGDPRCWPPGHKVNADDRARLGEDEANDRYGDRAGTEAITLTEEQGLILQSFRPNLPLQGNKTERWAIIGNAVPPVLAMHVAARGLGLEIPS